MSAEGVRLATLPNDLPIQHMVKFVCGYVAPPGDTQEPPPVKPGDYATAINIHNYTPDHLRIQKRVALHYREGTQLPPVPKPQWAVAYRFRVLEIDCVDIWNLIPAPFGTFVKGTVHIGIAAPAGADIPPELPVAAVYTVMQDIDGDHVPEFGGQSIDVEYIQPHIEPYIPPPDP